MLMKTCSKCGQALPATPDYFMRDRSKPDGLRTVCKACDAKTKQPYKKCDKCQRLLIARHYAPDDWINPRRVCFRCQGLKWCAKCDHWFPATIEYFYPCKTTSDGWRSWCRACYAQLRIEQSEQQRTHNREYYRQHREESLANRSRYYREHKEEAQAYHHDYRRRNKDKRNVWNRRRRRAQHGRYTSADIRQHYKSQKGLCWWCSKPLGETYHVDHRVPISRGGSDNPENLCLTCPHCNLNKSDKMPWEWIGRLL
jgi:hypothetical protein